MLNNHSKNYLLQR